MQNLEKRVAALEQVAQTTGIVNTIIIMPMTTGDSDAEIQRLHSQDSGQEWTRRPDETESQFEDRAMGELDRKGKPIVMLVATAWRQQMHHLEGTEHANT